MHFYLAGQIGIYLSVVVLGIGSWFYVPALLTIPMRLSGATPERVAAVWGSYMTFSGLGMFVFPILVGWTVRRLRFILSRFHHMRGCQLGACSSREFSCPRMPAHPSPMRD